MSPTFLFAALLIALASGLTVWHVKAWETARSTKLEPDEARFRWRQFRRRIAASILLAAVGVAMFGSALLERPVVLAFYWLGVPLLALALIWLALLDMRATARRFAELTQRHRAEHAKLMAELSEPSELGGNASNGHSVRPDGGQG